MKGNSLRSQNENGTWQNAAGHATHPFLPAMKISPVFRNTAYLRVAEGIS